MHGTVAMYQRHLRAGEPACEACKDAKNRYNRSRRTGRWEIVVDAAELDTETVDRLQELIDQLVRGEGHELPVLLRRVDSMQVTP